MLLQEEKRRSETNMQTPGFGSSSISSEINPTLPELGYDFDEYLKMVAATGNETPTKNPSDEQVEWETVSFRIKRSDQSRTLKQVIRDYGGKIEEDN